VSFWFLACTYFLLAAVAVCGGVARQKLHKMKKTQETSPYFFKRKG
jgi:hypothetical protein